MDSFNTDASSSSEIGTGCCKVLSDRVIERVADRNIYDLVVGGHVVESVTNRVGVVATGENDDLGVDPGRVDDRIQRLLEAARRIHGPVEGELKMV